MILKNDIINYRLIGQNNNISGVTFVTYIINI